MEEKEGQDLINYVKGYKIPKKGSKNEDKHMVLPLPSKKLSGKENNKSNKQNKSSKLKRIKEQKETNLPKKEDIKEPNKIKKNKENKEIDLDANIKKLNEMNQLLKVQIERKEKYIIKYKKKYEDQLNIIKNLELILSEQKEQKKQNKTNITNTSKNEINNNNNKKHLNDIELINEILACEIESLESEKYENENFEDNDLLYDDKYQEQIAINQVDQQIIDELYPNPDAMSYEQLLQLEENMGHVNKGLSKSQFEKLPNVKYDKNKYSENYLCIICMEEFQKNEKVKLLPCGHIFHDNCIKQWLLKQKTCPFCKSEIG